MIDKSCFFKQTSPSQKSTASSSSGQAGEAGICLEFERKSKEKKKKQRCVWGGFDDDTDKVEITRIIGLMSEKLMANIDEEAKLMRIVTSIKPGLKVYGPRAKCAFSQVDEEDDVWTLVKKWAAMRKDDALWVTDFPLRRYWVSQDKPIEERRKSSSLSSVKRLLEKSWMAQSIQIDWKKGKIWVQGVRVANWNFDTESLVVDEEKVNVIATELGKDTQELIKAGRDPQSTHHLLNKF